MSHDPNCIFCRIVAGEVPSATVLDEADSLAFLDVGPLAPGHTLIIPKPHYETISEMPPELLSSVMAHIPRLARAVMTATGAAGLNLLQNNGREAGQSVNHVHFHLIPRKPGGAFRIPWPAGKYEANEMNDLRERIAQRMQ